MFDFIGVLILIMLVAVFGFLTTRAWKLKNALLKWTGVFISGLLTLVPTTLLVLALIGFSKLNVRYDNPATAVQVAKTPAQIARGEQLANTCTSCHSPGNELPLSGASPPQTLNLASSVQYS
jgi:mono/diheme cytochrome c family protein